MAFENIKEDYRSLNKKEISLFRFLKTFFSNTGFQVVTLFRLANFFYRKNVKFLPTVIMRLVYHFYHCDIRYTADIGSGFVIAHAVSIVIGGKVKAGKNLSIRQGVTLGGNSGKTRQFKAAVISQPVLGDNVLLGCNTAVLGPVLVTDNCIIGAGGILLKDACVSGTYAGVPAKLLKTHD